MKGSCKIRETNRILRGVTLLQATAQSDPILGACQAQAPCLPFHSPCNANRRLARPAVGCHSDKAARQASGCAYLLPVELRAPDEHGRAIDRTAQRRLDRPLRDHAVGITVTARILHVCAPRGLYVLPPSPFHYSHPPRRPRSRACLFDADMGRGTRGGAPRLPSPHAEDHELSSSWRKMCHADRATPGGGAPVYTSVGARSSAEGKSKGDNARQTAALPAPAWAAELTKPRGGSKPRAGALSAVEAPAPPRNSEPIASFPSAVRLPSPPPRERERERIAIAVAGGRKRKANVPTSPTRPNGSAGRAVSRPPRGRAYK